MWNMRIYIIWFTIVQTRFENFSQNEFKINPYDRCLEKNINKKQWTIARYLDDTKLSHVDKEVNDEIIEDIKKIEGITVYWGKKHNF